jgi:predicted kinase
MEAASARGARQSETDLSGLLLLVGGPIASGKSTVSHATAERLRATGVAAAAVDVDLVYELLEPRGHSPGDPAVWQRAHRLAGRLAAALFAEGVAVVIAEGDVLDEAAATSLLANAEALEVRRVTLRTSLETALERVLLDDDRGISRDPAFLARHYEQVAPALKRRPHDELVLDTDQLTIDETVAATVAACGSSRVLR